MGRWNGVYNTSKKVNRNIAIVILLALFANALGLFRMIGFNVAAPIAWLFGWSILDIFLMIGTPWIAFGLHKHKLD